MLDHVGDDRQDIWKNSVELIETSPASSHGESGEDSSQRVSSQLLRTIENEDILGNVLAKILHSLGFTGTCWTLWGSSSSHEKSICQSHVCSVSERGYDETSIVALILILIVEVSIQLLNGDKHLLATLISISLKSQLREPIEVSRTDVLIGKELVNDLSIVLFHDDERNDLQSVDCGEVLGLDTLNVSLYLLSVGVLQFLEMTCACWGSLVHLVRLQSIRDFLSPLDLSAGEQHLSNVLLNLLKKSVLLKWLSAVLHLHLSVVVVELLLKGVGDGLLQTLEPLLNLGCYLNSWLRQFKLFSFN